MLRSLQRKVIITIVFSPPRMDFALVSPLVPLVTQTEFLLHHQYNIKQTSNENKEKYQLGDYWLIQFQILQTNFIGIVW